MSCTGIVTALPIEARSLGAAPRDGRVERLAGGRLVALSGMGPANAVHAARTLIEAGAGALLCWGLAGGLDPALDCGDVVLATAVLDAAPFGSLYGYPATHQGWSDCIAAALPPGVPVARGLLLSCAEPLTAVAAKARWFSDTGALAVDMESAAVACVAAAHGLPFAALRVIIDTAADAVPSVIARALREGAVAHDGAPCVASGTAPEAAAALPAVTTGMRHLGYEVLLNPVAWPATTRLARRYRRARSTLRRCASAAVSWQVNL